MKRALLPVLMLGSCSSSDDLSITAHGHHCINGDPKKMKIRVADNGATYAVSVYGDLAMQDWRQGCRVTVDKKTEKVVSVTFYQ